MKETTFLFKVCCWQKKVGDKSFRVKERSDGSCHYHFNANSGKWLYRPEPNECKKEFKELCCMYCSFKWLENPVGIMTRVERKSFFFLNLNKNGHFKLFLHLSPTHEASMNNFDKKKAHTWIISLVPIKTSIVSQIKSCLWPLEERKQSTRTEKLFNCTRNIPKRKINRPETKIKNCLYFEKCMRDDVM